MLLYEVPASEEDARLMKRSYTGTAVALRRVVQAPEPQTSLGVSSPDLCLLFLEVWAPFWFDRILHVFRKARCAGGVLLDIGKSGADIQGWIILSWDQILPGQCSFFSSWRLKLLQMLFSRGFGRLRDRHDVWFLLALRCMYQSISTISWGWPSCCSSSGSLPPYMWVFY